MLHRRQVLEIGAIGLFTVAASPGTSLAQTSGRIEERLKDLGLALPTQGPAPVANYTPVIIEGYIAHVSGQIPLVDGKLAFVGRVGSDLTLEQGQAAARQIGVNTIAHLKLALNGDLDRVRRVLRVDGFVSSALDFTEQAKVMNGFSNLMTEVFGDGGIHTRTAVGVNVLPLNAPVEINAMFLVS